MWRKAIDFADLVYAATRSFPDDERFGLRNQMRRAAVSVSSNIAEGSGRTSKKDFARFVELAYGSLMEIVSQLEIASKMKSRGITVVYDISNLKSAIRNVNTSLLKFSAGRNLVGALKEYLDQLDRQLKRL